MSSEWDDLRTLATRATPGPWHFAYCGIYADAKVQTEEDWWTEERMNDGHTYDHRAGEACPACGPRTFQHTDGTTIQAWDCALAGDALDQEALIARVRPSYGDTATGRRRADAEFIAACPPDVILALVAELVGLRTEVDQLRGERDELVRQAERGEVASIASRRSICAQRDALQAELAKVEHERDEHGNALGVAAKLCQTLAASEIALRAEVAALQARIDAVTALHTKSRRATGFSSLSGVTSWAETCDYCSQRHVGGYETVRWPCDTIRALGVDPQKEAQQ